MSMLELTSGCRDGESPARRDGLAGSIEHASTHNVSPISFACELDARSATQPALTDAELAIRGFLMDAGRRLSKAQRIAEKPFVDRAIFRRVVE